MNELETVLAARITRLELTLVKLIAFLGSRALPAWQAEQLGEILKGVDNETASDKIRS